MFFFKYLLNMEWKKEGPEIADYSKEEVTKASEKGRRLWPESLKADTVVSKVMDLHSVNLTSQHHPGLVVTGRRKE